METLALGIGGMQSGACAGNLERRLYGIAGVQSAVVSFLQAGAEIVYDPALTDANKLANEVAEAGYAACLPSAASSPVAAASATPVSAAHTNSGCG